jgi:hypothetical protein
MEALKYEEATVKEQTYGARSEDRENLGCSICPGKKT